MIDKKFWELIARNWVTEDDGIDVPDDKKMEEEKVKEIKEDEILFADISNDEIDDILADLGLDDF